jgi:hypothetical protein
MTLLLGDLEPGGVRLVEVTMVVLVHLCEGEGAGVRQLYRPVRLEVIPPE